MKTAQLKSSIDDLTPSETQKARMLNDLLRRKREEESSVGVRFGMGNRRNIKISVTAAVLVICFLVGGSVLREGPPPLSFTMVAYAADMDGSRTLILEGTQVELPFGRLIRDQAIPQADGTTRYNTYLNGSNYFSVSGDNIKSVTYISELGELTYTDIIMRDADPEYIRARNEAKLMPGVGSIMVQSGPLSYEQKGNKVTAVYYKEWGDQSLAVRWQPWYVSMKMAANADINPADFPHEKITVTVSFDNEKIVTRTLYLSFTTDGTLIAELAKT
ncbi:hypothetical protein ACFQI7_08915 [Paenibacillus allorhizosphaerae]|uniref:DUF4179 domain-containing protein n=1 Tax=Paenibacillus allorhizosphaerae TaxID=2849866 RepID=A0ABN7TNV1_9BACL|nr:hypothetical protein [Paenibacillus allorhizosphaerae]CAG7643856.1 hypothetical protein PAECIP111802_03093 [Paenibacillus allorhizosphaerae]